jgi:tetratricopeptide (TPR) repeat protein
MDHLTAQQIEGVRTGSLEPAELKRAVRHLLTGCRFCLKRWLAHVPLEDEPGVEPASFPGEEEDYDLPLQRALEAALRAAPQWEEENNRLSRLLEKARSLPRGLVDVPQEDPDATPWAWVEALLEASFACRFRDPKEMLLLALCARGIADSLVPGESWSHSPARLADLQARVWGELANALRVNADFPGAENALRKANSLTWEGTGDVFLEARLLDLEASLRTSQRRLSAALEILERLQALYVSIQETHLSGRAMISRGINTFYDGRPAEAVSLLQEGLAFLEPGRDPDLELLGRKNLVDFLAEVGRYREAGRLLLESGLRKAFSDQPLNLLRLRWIEGKIQVGLGRLVKAAEILAEVRDGFEQLGEIYDAALVGIELAAVWLDLGRGAEARKLASDALSTFRKLDVEREALRAVAFLNDACRLEVASGAMAREVASFVKRVEWQPQLRFSP